MGIMDKVVEATKVCSAQPEPSGLDQSVEEEKTHHTMLSAVLFGHGSESAVRRSNRKRSQVQK